MDEGMVLSVVDMTSMALAPKLAMYKRPRDSSSAISEAEPPIATTDPKTAADTGAATAGIAASVAIRAKHPRRVIMKIDLL